MRPYLPKIVNGWILVPERPDPRDTEAPHNVCLSGKHRRNPKPDPYYPAVVERAWDAARRLQEAGIVDTGGRRIRADLPPHMPEGQDRDFGG
jgi:hypothetical protein